MKTSSSVLIPCFILLITGNLHSQDSLNHQTVFSEGIAVHGGIGWLAVRDEYISKERYAGLLPYSAIGWSRFHETYGYNLALEYRYGSAMKNHNVSAQITEFSLNLDYLYPVGEFALFSRDVLAYLGPSPELFLHLFGS